MADWETAPAVLEGGWETAPVAAKAAAPAYPPAPKPKDQPVSFGDDPEANIRGFIPETILSMGSAMIAKPVSDVAGLTRLGMEGLRRTGVPGIEERDPQTVKEDVQRALTYQPKTAAGEFGAQYNPLALLGKGVGAVARSAKESIAPPESGPVRAAVGYGVEELINQLPSVLGSAAGAKVAKGLPARQAALDVTKGENAMIDAVREMAQKKAKYLTPPEYGIKAAIMPDSAKRWISEKNADMATRRLGNEVGVPAGQSLSSAEFSRLKEETAQSYDAMVAQAGPELSVTPQFKAAIQSAIKPMEAALERNPVANSTYFRPRSLLRSFDKQTDFPSEATLLDIQKQRQWAKGDFKAGRDEMGTARLAVAHQLENLFEDNLAKTGNAVLVDQFRQARERFAKIYLLERITDDATGKVNLAKLGSLSQTKPYKGVLTGEFKDAADFAKTFRAAARRPTGEKAGRLSWFDGMFAASAVGSMHPGLMAGAALEIGGRMALPYAASKGLLQTKTPSYQVGAMRRALPAALPLAGATVPSQAKTPEEKLLELLSTQ